MSARPAPLIRSHLNGGDAHLLRRRLDRREAFRCLRDCVAGLRWAIEQLRDLREAGDLASDSDRIRCRAQFVEKISDLLSIAKRGESEASAWRFALSAQTGAAIDAYRAAPESEEARAGLRAAGIALLRWADGVTA